MITKAEIEKLAALSRVKLSETEKENFTSQIDAILGYVDLLKKVPLAQQSDAVIGTTHNVFRDDINPHESGMHTESLLAEAPDRKGNYLKVKQILS